ncbi:MAG: flagellar biosynthesis protein FliQ [Lachnospiraceae bacterium]|nr:flagellar biosynthesis protein FliQ [Lachnospiraceae bacterium]
MLTVGDVIDITSQAIWLIIKCSAPMLLASLIVGLIVSIFQTVTSIQEQTLTFVPKILTVFLVLILTGNWILNNIVAFIQDIYSRFGDFVG